jgi:hypothetical protein
MILDFFQAPIRIEEFILPLYIINSFEAVEPGLSVNVALARLGHSWPEHACEVNCLAAGYLWFLFCACTDTNMVVKSFEKLAMGQVCR